MLVETVLKIYRAFIGPIIVILGLLGNILVILVLSKRRISRFNVYSVSVVIANTAAIVFNSLLDDFFGRGLYYATKGRYFIKLDSLSILFCKLMEYLPNVAYFCSSYCLAVFAFDRFLIMKYPFKFSSDGRIRQSILICVGIFVIGVLTGLPLSIKNELVPTNSSFNYRNMTCQVSTNHSWIGTLGIYYKSIVIFVIPTITVFGLNASLIYLVVSMFKQRKGLAVGSTSSNKVEINRLIGMVALSTYFLCFTIPLSVIIIIRLKLEASCDEGDPELTRIRYLSKLFSSLKDICYSSNFLIYFIFVGYFKTDLKRIFHVTELTSSIFSSKHDTKHNQEPPNPKQSEEKENLVTERL